MTSALEDQLAEERRQRAEDTPPEPEPEPEEDDEDESDEQIEPESQPPTLSPEEVERAFKKAEKVQARYETQLAAALGPIFADLQPSPLDDVPGYVFPFNPATDIGDMKRAAVAAYFGDDAINVVDDPDTEMCPRCEGACVTKTGSRTPPHDTRPCTQCGAVGWVFKPGKGPKPEYQPVAGEIVPESLNANGAGGEKDAFGRPWGHPNYGAIPLYTGDN